MAHHPTVPPDWSGGQDNSIPLPPLLLQELVEALRSIRFGTIELVMSSRHWTDRTAGVRHFESPGEIHA